MFMNKRIIKFKYIWRIRIFSFSLNGFSFLDWMLNWLPFRWKSPEAILFLWSNKYLEIENKISYFSDLSNRCMNIAYVVPKSYGFRERNDKLISSFCKLNAWLLKFFRNCKKRFMTWVKKQKKIIASSCLKN